jgi:hypothetical protein
MVEILAQPDQRTDSTSLGGGTRARNPLNTAPADLAVATSATQSQLTWVVDGYTVALACLLLPAGMSPAGGNRPGPQAENRLRTPRWTPGGL